MNAFNTLVAAVNAGGNDVEANKRLVHDFVYVSIMEAVAAKVIKTFFNIVHPFTGQPFTIGIFTEDNRRGTLVRGDLRRLQPNKPRLKQKLLNCKPNKISTPKDQETLRRRTLRHLELLVMVGNLDLLKNLLKMKLLGLTRMILRTFLLAILGF